MKTLLLLVTAITAFAGPSPAQSAPPASPSAIEIRIRQIDVDVALKHYEKLQTMMRETRLERDLQRGTLGSDNPEVQLTERKMEIIGKSIGSLKSEIETLGARLDTVAPAPPPSDFNPRR